MKEEMTPESAALKEETAGKTIEGNEKEANVTTDVSKGSEAGKGTTAKTEEAAAGFNPETRFNELADRYAKLEKRHKDAERFGTQSSMKAAEMEKQLKALSEQIAKLSETPIDPQEFLRDVNKRGHLPIMELVKKELEKQARQLSESYEAKLTAAEDNRLHMEADWTRDRLAADATNFPNYRELEKTFGDILDEDPCPVRADLPIRDQLVALYQVARNRNAEKAVKLAHAEGKQEAEKELVKEAKTAVTGGGKAPGTTVPNIDNMNVDDARKALIGIYGVADR